MAKELEHNYLKAKENPNTFKINLELTFTFKYQDRLSVNVRLKYTDKKFKTNILTCFLRDKVLYPPMISIRYLSTGVMVHKY